MYLDIHLLGIDAKGKEISKSVWEVVKLVVNILQKSALYSFKIQKIQWLVEK